jgi:hypothetical protein
LLVLYGVQGGVRRLLLSQVRWCCTFVWWCLVVASFVEVLFLFLFNFFYKTSLLIYTRYALIAGSSKKIEKVERTRHGLKILGRMTCGWNDKSGEASELLGRRRGDCERWDSEFATAGGAGEEEVKIQLPAAELNFERSD